ncbi:hypothetical protein [Pseudomonas sp. TE3610]
MDELKLFGDGHWIVTHRRDARHDGYLIISSEEEASELSDLSGDALASLGLVMKRLERLLVKVYAPCKVIFYKLGFSQGFNVHFHVAPVSDGLLKEISSHPSYSDHPDGNDAIVYLSRELCERPLTTAETEKQLLAIRLLRASLSAV